MPKYIVVFFLTQLPSLFFTLPVPLNELLCYTNGNSVNLFWTPNSSLTLNFVQPWRDQFVDSYYRMGDSIPFSLSWLLIIFFMLLKIPHCFHMFITQYSSYWQRSSSCSPPRLFLFDCQCPTNAVTIVIPWIHSASLLYVTLRTPFPLPGFPLCCLISLSISF